jgi:murein tripeptide amidase MpaA
MIFLGIKKNEKNQKKGFQTARFETLKFLGLALLFWCNLVFAGGDLLEVEFESEQRLHILQSLVPDIEILNENKVLLYADKRLQNVLKRREFKFTIKISDLSEFYARRAQADMARRNKTMGSMGGFRTFAEIEQTLDQLVQTYPQFISKFSIGKSFEGRDIWALKISANSETKPAAWFDALHHSREPLSAELVLRFVDNFVKQYFYDLEIMRLMHTRNIIVVPCVNPDGYEYNRQTNPQGGGMWRKNRRPNLDGSYGVDLNRNYGWKWGTVVYDTSMENDSYQGVSAFSEAETSALRDLMALEKPRFAVTLHSYGNEWMFPWGYTDDPSLSDSLFRYYADRLTDKNGYVAENGWHLYGATSGTTDDYLYATYGTLAYTLEAGTYPDGFWPAPSHVDPIFEDVYPSFKQIVQWAGASPIMKPMWKEVYGNGDQAFDAGEVWELQLNITNEGTLPLDGFLNIYQQNQNISIDNPLLALSIAPRETWISTPVTIYISEKTQHIESINLIWNFENFSTPQILKIPIGKARLIAWDDMDVADFAWNVSNPQEKWAWHRTVPHFVSPETTPTSKCWVTGSGDALLNYNVHGLTMLTSPRFSALGLDNLELSYRRWFANVGGAQDDRLDVQISNDDGATWRSIERIPNRNHWENAQFNLESVLPLTDRMRLRFIAQDAMNDDITEACIDEISLKSRSSLPTVGVWGKVATGEWLRMVVDGKPFANVQVYASFQTENPYSLPNMVGELFLSGHIFPLWQAQINAQGQAIWLLQCPDFTEFKGYRLYVQALLTNPDQTFEISRPTVLTFE